MFADYLYVITDSLRGRRSHNDQISDRLLDDIGLTRAEYNRQQRSAARRAYQR
ncbi:MAG: hypothetical protein ACO1OG_07955 [Devosia sp.]